MLGQRKAGEREKKISWEGPLTPSEGGRTPEQGCCNNAKEKMTGHSRIYEESSRSAAKCKVHGLHRGAARLEGIRGEKLGTRSRNIKEKKEREGEDKKGTRERNGADSAKTVGVSVRRGTWGENRPHS